MGEIEDRLNSIEETLVDLFGLMGRNQGQTALWRHRVEELEGRMATAEEQIAAEAAAETDLATQVKDLGTRVTGHLNTLQTELDKAVAAGFQVSTALQNSVNAMKSEAAAIAAIDPTNPAATPIVAPPVSTPTGTSTAPVPPETPAPTDTTTAPAATSTPPVEATPPATP